MALKHENRGAIRREYSWIEKLTKDNKEIYIAEISDGKVDDDALTLLMKSWKTSFIPQSKAKEYEDREYANHIYRKLGWKQNKYDIICSAWTTYIALLVAYAQANSIKYTDFDSNINGNKVMYHYTEKKKLGYWYFYGGEKEATFQKSNRKHPDSSYYNKFLDNKTVHSRFAKKVTDEITGILELSGLCHCVANFMPCPDVDGEKYNLIKGCLPDVRDYLPLMIDKIQKCVSENTALKYLVDNEEKIISYDIIKSWHEFFLQKRREIFLDEFYYIKQKSNKFILVGIPLFMGQSLENPMPNNLNEAKDCLDNILYIVQNRALKMAAKCVK